MFRPATILTACLAVGGAAACAAEEPKPSKMPPAAADETTAAEKPDTERILGHWKATRFYVNEQLQSLMPDDSIVVEFTADGFKAKVAIDGGTQEIDGTYFLDAK